MPCAAQENTAPKGSRFLIAIIGRTNVGKSTLLNVLVGEDVAITSHQAGTTTDAVIKHYELLPFGPVTFYDTAGLDDEGGKELSQKRIKATMKVLWRADMALLVTDNTGIGAKEKAIIKRLKELAVPYLIIANKCEIARPTGADVYVSAAKKQGIDNLRSLIVSHIPKDFNQERKLTAELVQEGATIALVTPIDASAPVGRLILPQVQVLREVLDAGAFAIVTQKITDKVLSKSPDLVITDSQVIAEVAKVTPKTIPLTTFSILYARAKGDIDAFIQGAKVIPMLKDGDKILIAEACSHNYQQDDIGRVKIPKMLSNFTGKDLTFAFCTGHNFSDNLEDYKLVIHCGACMLGAKEMMRRITECQRRKIPITNYGFTISMVKGVLDRVVVPLMIRK